MEFPYQKIGQVIKNVNLNLIPTIQKNAINHLANKLKNNQQIEYSDFKEIPVVNKKIFFEDKGLYKGLSAIHPLKIILSAGDTYDLSFRASSHEEYDAPMAQFLQMYKLKVENILLLNCYPFGISLPGSVNSIDIGARGNLLNKLFDTFAPYYETVILLIQPHFLKYYLDTHHQNHIDIKKTFLVLGGHWFSSKMSDYIARCLNVNVDLVNSKMISSFGSAEVGLGIGTQTPIENTIRKTLPSPAPMVLRVDWSKYFLEEVSNKIIVTQLLVPSSAGNVFSLFRYELGDNGFLKDGLLYLSERVCNQDIVKLQEIILDDSNLFGLVNLKFKIMDNIIQLQVYKKEDNEKVYSCIKKYFPSYDIKIINLDNEDIYHYNPMLKIRYE